jgi:hypothetical protein
MRGQVQNFPSLSGGGPHSLIVLNARGEWRAIVW